MDYIQRLQALFQALYFEGADRVIVAFQAAKGHVDFAIETEGDDGIADANIPYALSQAQRDRGGQWFWPDRREATVPVRIAVADALQGYLSSRAPWWWIASAGSAGTVVLNVEHGTVKLELKRNRRPRGRNRKRQYRARRR